MSRGRDWVSGMGSSEESCPRWVDRSEPIHAVSGGGEGGRRKRRAKAISLKDAFSELGFSPLHLLLSTWFQPLYRRLAVVAQNRMNGAAFVREDKDSTQPAEGREMLSQHNKDGHEVEKKAVRPPTANMIEQGQAEAEPMSSSSRPRAPTTLTPPTPPPTSLPSPLLPLLSTYSLLIFASFWGILARLGLIWLGWFAEREVFPLVWAQVVGCAVMGLVLARREGLERM